MDTPVMEVDMGIPNPEPVGPGEESVWSYPRPPRLEREPRAVRIDFGGGPIAETQAAWRVLETSHPPVYYLPRGAFVDGALRRAPGESFCEWKGSAQYWDVIGLDGAVAARAGWSYPTPTPRFAELADHVAVYAAMMDACFVGGEQVTPQPGRFYGGWVTSWVKGPFKGGPGSWGW
jgi:uncharacterized protein (DUF427 family)